VRTRVWFLNTIILPDSINCHLRACLFSSRLSLYQKDGMTREFTQVHRSPLTLLFLNVMRSELSCQSLCLCVGRRDVWWEAGPLVYHRVQRERPVRSSKLAKTRVEIKSNKNMELASKPNATAAVWEHFGFNER